LIAYVKIGYHTFINPKLKNLLRTIGLKHIKLKALSLLFTEINDKNNFPSSLEFALKMVSWTFVRDFSLNILQEKWVVTTLII
jgi:hypothetical protein